MKTFSDIHLTSGTAHMFGADLGVRTGRVGAHWAGPGVPFGGRISTEVAAGRNLHALAAGCAG